MKKTLMNLERDIAPCEDQNNPSQDASQEILAIIPARAGSKGIPRKNLIPLGGVPLIAHSIMAARACSMITRVIVSTESEEIAKTAKTWGAEVPFLRPQNLSDDRSLIGDAIAHLLTQLRIYELYQPYCFVVLLPTHPFRSAALMDHMTSKLLQGYGIVKTVYPVLVDSASYLCVKDDAIASLHGNKKSIVCYKSYGLYDGQRCSKADRNGVYNFPLLSKNELIDIDTFEDLEKAELILKRKEFVPEWM